MDGVDGEAEDRRREAGHGKGLTCALDVLIGRTGAEVETVSADGDGRVGGAVEKDAKVGRPYCVDNVLREEFQIAAGEIFLADLKEVGPAAGRPARGKAQGLVEKRALASGFDSRKEMPVSDGVAQHGFQCILVAAGGRGYHNDEALPGTLSRGRTDAGFSVPKGVSEGGRRLTG